MSTEVLYVIYGSVFVGVLLLVETLTRLVVDSRTGAQALNRRLRLLAAGNTRQATMVRLRRPFEPDAGSGRLRAWVGIRLAQAGLELSFGRYVAVMAALGIVGGGAALLVTRNPFAAMVVAGLLGFVLPAAFVAVKRGRRLNRFGQQLPDALDVMVRSLRAGHPLPTAIGLVAREMPDPIGSAFGLAADEMSFGLDLPDALTNMAARVGHDDLRLMVVSVGIQAGVGGNLAELLGNLATIIRARFRMRAKIKALSAEGRFSAGILSMLPVVLGVVLSLMNPAYYGEVADNPLFAPVMAGTFVLMLFGDFIMYRMVNFKV